nr:MAG: hypothetical protein [Pigeon-associated parvo-like virus]
MAYEQMRRWYAMRDRLMKEGKWKGKGPAHPVPAQEEGEPARKAPRFTDRWPDPATERAPVEPGGSKSAGGDDGDSPPPLEAPWTAEGNNTMAFPGGFSIFAWVKEDSPLLDGLSDDTRDTMRREILKDAKVLWGVKWNLQFDEFQFEGRPYIYASTNRFTASNATIAAALGGLLSHVEFIRSAPDIAAEHLYDFNKAKRKWKVEERAMESSSGWGEQEPAGTSRPFKRPRY